MALTVTLVSAEEEVWHGEASLVIYDPVSRRGVVALTNGANGGDVIHRIAGMLDGDERLARFVVAGYGN